MTRVSVLLAIVAVICALGVVTSQHQSRKLFVELEREQNLARSLEVEWGQLKLESSTWATHSRVERIASARLRMQAPPPARVRVIPIETTFARAPQ